MNVLGIRSDIKEASHFVPVPKLNLSQLRRTHRKQSRATYSEMKGLNNAGGSSQKKPYEERGTFKYWKRSKIWEDWILYLCFICPQYCLKMINPSSFLVNWESLEEAVKRFYFVHIPLTRKRATGRVFMFPWQRDDWTAYMARSFTQWHKQSHK